MSWWALFAPIVVYWVYSGVYVMLGGLENYCLHPKGEDDVNNVLSKVTIVKGILVHQAFQITVSLLLFMVTWSVFAIFIPVTAICIWYQQYYIPTARVLTRLSGIQRASILYHFAELLSGVGTISTSGQKIVSPLQISGSLITTQDHGFIMCPLWNDFPSG